jgi:hypothetical protein
MPADALMKGPTLPFPLSIQELHANQSPQAVDYPQLPFGLGEAEGDDASSVRCAAALPRSRLARRHCRPASVCVCLFPRAHDARLRPKLMPQAPRRDVKRLLDLNGLQLRYRCVRRAQRRLDSSGVTHAPAVLILPTIPAATWSSRAHFSLAAAAPMQLRRNVQVLPCRRQHQRYGGGKRNEQWRQVFVKVPREKRSEQGVRARLRF